MTGRLLLLLGPTGVGKSTIIRELCTVDDRFVYVRPLTTRPLRLGETDKIRVTPDEIARLQREGELVAVNHLYGVTYGTPRAPIDTALRDGHTAVLDWPVEQVPKLRTAYASSVSTVYLAPPSAEALRDRLTQRDGDSARLAIALEELENFSLGRYDELIDHRFVVETNRQSKVANEIAHLF